MLTFTYFSQNYASIIRQGLLSIQAACFLCWYSRAKWRSLTAPGVNTLRDRRGENIGVANYMLQPPLRGENVCLEQSSLTFRKAPDTNPIVDQWTDMCYTIRDGSINRSKRLLYVCLLYVIHNIHVYNVLGTGSRGERLFCPQYECTLLQLTQPKPTVTYSSFFNLGNLYSSSLFIQLANRV